MAVDVEDTLGYLIRKLERLNDLDHADRAAVRSLSVTLDKAPAGRLLLRDRDQAQNCCLLLEGYACRHKMTSTGGRQIVSFHMPGDILDLQHLLLPTADHNVQTITPARFAWIPIDELSELALARPAIAAALWRDTLIDASIFREWVLNVGRRDAKSRIAHMLCEFAVRRQKAGLGAPETFEMPMTQEQIGDATGLTPVHVNRMLQALSEEGVIERDKRVLTIVDWNKMRRIADFDAAYLHEAA